MAPGCSCPEMREVLDVSPLEHLPEKGSGLVTLSRRACHSALCAAPGDAREVRVSLKSDLAASAPDRASANPHRHPQRTSPGTGVDVPALFVRSIHLEEGADPRAPRPS